MAVKTESLHVVPKADVDRMFEKLYDMALDKNGKFAQKLRGIAYANTFYTIRTTIIVEDDHRERPTQ